MARRLSSMQGTGEGERRAEYLDKALQSLQRENRRLQRELSRGDPHFGVEHKPYTVSPIYQSQSQRQHEDKKDPERIDEEES